MSDLKPWEQQDEESPQAFSAFIIFRDIGLGRNLSEASRRYHGGESEGDAKTESGRLKEASGTIREWATKYHWRERVAAYDRELDRRRVEAQAKLIAEADSRHLQMAKAMIVKSAERITKMDPSELTPSEVRQFIDTAVKIERLVLGESTEKVEQHTTVKADLSGLADPEILEMLAEGKQKRLQQLLEQQDGKPAEPKQLPPPADGGEYV